jgi:hypothetical protein
MPTPSGCEISVFPIEHLHFNLALSDLDFGGQFAAVYFLQAFSLFERITEWMMDCPRANGLR